MGPSIILICISFPFFFQLCLLMAHWEKQWCGDQDTKLIACLFLILEFLDQIFLYVGFLSCLFKESGGKLPDYIRDPHPPGSTADDLRWS